jgi:hypothetical protein
MRITEKYLETLPGPARGHILVLREMLAKEKARADAAERRERDLQREFRALQARLAAIESAHGST